MEVATFKKAQTKPQEVEYFEIYAGALGQEVCVKVKVRFPDGECIFLSPVEFAARFNKEAD